jgi:hypothetical protein
MLFLFSCFSFAGIAQYTLKGKVTDISGKPLFNVSITAEKPNSTNIISFAISDNNGNYQLIINEQIDSVKLIASLIGFESNYTFFSIRNSIYNFKLKPGEIKLKEVIVKKSPVYQKKDTVNYSVEAFTSKQDRVIADVIKKLPGMDVRSDGTIYYQGKLIQKYFINGLDLLEGRYNLANNNLPADAVRDVQVIENDQPIKILDSLVFSDKTSLNLRLKKFITTGFAKLGLGANPVLWETNVTPMTFNKNFQAINSVQINNIGEDVTKDLQTLSTEELFNQSNKPSSPLLFIEPLVTPSFDKQWWLKNNVHLFSSNILKKLRSGLQLKTNIYFVNDNQEEFGNTKTTFVTQNETIDISEVKENSFASNKLNGNFILEKNTRNVYFKNNLQIQRSWDNNTGNLLNTTTNVFQHLNNETFYLSNKLSAIKAIGKQLININSISDYNHAPQTLYVTPGQFDSVINNKVAYGKVLQSAQINYFQTNNYIGFTKGIRHFILMPKLGFHIEKQQLNSSIIAFKQNDEVESSDSLKNNISFLRTTFYGVFNIQYNSDIWKIYLGIPVNFRYFDTENLNSTRNKNISRFTFEPELNILYKISQFLQASITSKINNNFGDVSQLYTSYILQSYRNFQRFNTSFPEIKSFSNNISFNYKNPLNSIFSSLGYSIYKIKNNLLLISHVNLDGSTTLESLLKNNFQQSQSINGSASKYFTEIKTIFKIEGNFDFNNSEQIINNIYSTINNNNFSVSLNINNNLSDYLSFIYEGKYSIQKSRLSEKSVSNIRMQQHSLNINFFPLSNQMLTVNAKYYRDNINTERNQTFINIFYRYTFQKKKIDLQLNCNNLLNTKYFTNVYDQSFLRIENSYELRPRQFVGSVRFIF